MRTAAVITALVMIALALWHWWAGVIGLIMLAVYAALYDAGTQSRAAEYERLRRELVARVQQLDEIIAIIAAVRAEIERNAEEEKTL